MWIKDVFLNDKIESDYEFKTGGRFYSNEKAKIWELLNIQKPNKYELYINKKYLHLYDKEILNICKKLYINVIITSTIPENILYVLREVKK